MGDSEETSSHKRHKHKSHKKSRSDDSKLHKHSHRHRDKESRDGERHHKRSREDRKHRTDCNEMRKEECSDRSDLKRSRESPDTFRNENTYSSSDDDEYGSGEENYASNSNSMARYDSSEDHRSKCRRVSPPKEVWGKPGDADSIVPEQPDPNVVKEKVNFGLSGALARDAVTGNMKNGVVLKYSTPLDAAMPTKKWRLYVFKDNEIIDTLHLHRQSSYCIGRDDRVADIVVAHTSISKQHCVLQFRAVSKNKKPIIHDGVLDADGHLHPDIVVKPYLMDLSSANKTFVNNNPIEEARYYELFEKDTIKFGCSTREYVLLSA